MEVYVLVCKIASDQGFWLSFRIDIWGDKKKLVNFLSGNHLQN